MINDRAIEQLMFDSRKPVIVPDQSVFFAINGINHDGHRYLIDLYKKGVRFFIVEENVDRKNLPEASILRVESSIDALQEVAAAHRKSFDIDVIGITGSNGKTIVKEWLYQILSVHRNIVKSPSSFNSQIGVPLSVWQIQDNHDLGLFEAGISKRGEMDRISRVIQPTLGIFTNIGSAHDEGFQNREEKISEKMKLFTECKLVIYCRDHENIHQSLPVPGFTWGRHPDSNLRILGIEKGAGFMKISFDTIQPKLRIPFTDPASLENAMHVVACLKYLGLSWTDIQEGLDRLRPLRMRLELRQAKNNCNLIDDTYNNDIAGLKNAIDFLSNVGQREKKSLILSDIPQSGMDEKVLIQSINSMLRASGIRRFIGIGPVLYAHQNEIDVNASFYKSTSEFLDAAPEKMFSDEVILVKGARKFQFEDIVGRLEEKIHGTVLEVDLTALTHNLNHFRSHIRENVRIMVMVKAFAYGSGSLEVANLLQFHRVDYLGVAYADEGITLRRNGIRLPIMVMNPAADSFGSMMDHSLEPEIYSFTILKELLHYLQGRPMKIHLKLDTGMHRLGFIPEEIAELCVILRDHPELKVESIFSHLASSESDEVFSAHQAGIFQKMSKELIQVMTHSPLRHLLNSSGIIKYPEYHFDMVRLGIGLYGLEVNSREQHRLRSVSTLRTIISQIKEVEAGETIGYGRMGKVDTRKRIATIAIGYADGFPRVLGNGKGQVVVNGKRASVVGNVCMDMTMIDITGIEANEGDSVEIFGENLSLIELAQMCGTIPYEVLTNVSQRVKRVFFSD